MSEWSQVATPWPLGCRALPSKRHSGAGGNGDPNRCASTPGGLAGTVLAVAEKTAESGGDGGGNSE